MKIEELRSKKIDELQTLLREQEENLNDLRFKISVNQLKTVNEVSDTCKMIARILTILKEKQLNNKEQ